MGKLEEFEKWNSLVYVFDWKLAVISVIVSLLCSIGTTFVAEELKEYYSHLYGIMPNERMFRFTKSYMEHEIVRGIKETGVKRIRIHDLRHSHASLLVELGFQPLAIAERLGHEKIETTLNTYSHLYPNKQAELADRLELENEEDKL